MELICSALDPLTAGIQLFIDFSFKIVSLLGIEPFDLRAAVGDLFGCTTF
jgi:hypothetical protein